MSHKLPLTPAQEALIGTMPDKKLADHLGCSEWAIRSRRWSAGIPTFTDMQKGKSRIEGYALAKLVNDSGWPRPMGDVIDQLHRESWLRRLGAM